MRQKREHIEKLQPYTHKQIYQRLSKSFLL